MFCFSLVFRLLFIAYITTVSLRFVAKPCPGLVLAQADIGLFSFTLLSNS
jgi:hypothetical protein